MKKNYLFLAAAATMFTACVQSDLVSEIPEAAPQAISFETFANKQTRATENSTADYTWALEYHHSKFNVWASKQTATGYVEVWQSGNPGVAELNGSWTPTPKKYWDKAALNYYFYAAAPASIGWIYSNKTSGDGSTGFLKLNNYTLEGTLNDNLAANTTDAHNSWGSTTGNDIDLLIAHDCDVPNGTYNVDAPSNVNLNFYHLLSRLNIRVKKTGDATIIVNNLDVYKVKNSGSFNEDGATINTTGSTERWNTTSSTYTLGMKGSPLTLGTDAVYTHEYLVIPQLQTNTEATVNQGSAPTTDAYIYINYTVDGEVFESYYGLAQVFGTPKTENLAFNEGWQNTLTINIAPDAILFDTKVAEWSGTDKVENLD